MKSVWQDEWDNIIRANRLTLVANFDEEVYRHFFDLTVEKVTTRSIHLKGQHGAVTFMRFQNNDDVFMRLEDLTWIHYKHWSKRTYRFVNGMPVEEPRLQDLFEDIQKWVHQENGCG